MIADEARPGERGQAARALLASIGARRGAGLIGLSVASSITEGLGLLLLVPLLALMSGGEAAGGFSGQFAALLRAAGLPLRLEALLALFVGLVALRSLIVQARGMAEAQMQLEVADRQRERLFAALIAANWRAASRHRHSDLLTALANTVDRIGVAAQQMFQFAAALVTVLTMLGATLLIAPLPALVLGAGGLGVLAAYTLLRRRAYGEGEALHEAYAGYYAFFTERLEALRLLKTYQAGDRETAEARRVGQRLRDVRAGYQRGVALGQAALQTGSALVLAVGVWAGIRAWQVPASELLPLIALVARCVPLLGALQSTWDNWQHNLPSVIENDRLCRELEAAAEPAPALPETAASPLPRGRALGLNAVTVVHPGRPAPALDRVSLALPPGSTTLLTGPSGAGKSTLADVLSGLVAPDSGCLEIDGVPVDPAALRQWRGRVAYVQQEPLLFHASIRQNLLWARPDASEQRLREGLVAASADFVFALPKGLDTIVGDRGGRLSGGERQRIALARGLLREPDLLVLDEVTSALDPENEAAVTRAIAQLRGRVTILMIGHRGLLSSLADRIVQLDNGQIVAGGDTSPLDHSGKAGN